jgi:hypothetical protein
MPMERGADRDIGKRPCKFTEKNRGVEIAEFFYAGIDALMRKIKVTYRRQKLLQR